MEFDVGLLAQHAAHGFDYDQLVIYQQDADLEYGQAGFHIRLLEGPGQRGVRHVILLVMRQPLVV
jgi:hypothetical protein